MGESGNLYGQYKNIVIWTCQENFHYDNGAKLHEGVTYILCGHGLTMAAIQDGVTSLDAKDVTGISRMLADSLVIADNAAPEGSTPDMEKLLYLMAQSQDIVPEESELFLMLSRHKDTGVWQSSASDESGGQVVENPLDEWQDMPDFSNPEKPSFQKIVIHFNSAEDVEKFAEKFAELLGQTVTEKTKWIWFPPRPEDSYSDEVYSTNE